MKYIIIPIFKLIFVLIWGPCWLIGNLIIYIWDFKWEPIAFYQSMNGFHNKHEMYKTPIDYILGRNIWKD
jgi:hypothetical protein